MGLVKADGVVGRFEGSKVDPRAVIVEAGWNPRSDFGDINQLAQNILNNGLLNPLAVRNEGGKIYLVDGERRLRACMVLIEQGHDMREVPAIFEGRGISQDQRLANAIAANDSKRLNAAELAEAWLRLRNYGWEQKEIATKFGCNPSTVSRNLTVAKGASPAVKKALAAGMLPFAAAFDIAKAAGTVADQGKLLEAELGRVVQTGTGNAKAAPKRAGGKSPETKRAQTDRTVQDAKAGKKAAAPRRNMMAFKEAWEQVRLAESFAKQADQDEDYTQAAHYKGIIAGLKIACRVEGLLLPSGQLDTAPE